MRWIMRRAAFQARRFAQAVSGTVPWRCALTTIFTNGRSGGMKQPWVSLGTMKSAIGRNSVGHRAQYTQASNAAVAAAYRERLQQIGGVRICARPMPMRNTRGALSITCSLHRLTGRGRKSYPTSLTGTVTGDCLMATYSAIEWTESTRGIDHRLHQDQPGLRCYAERMARRLQAMGQPNYVNGFEVATRREHAAVLPLAWKSRGTFSSTR